MFRTLAVLRGWTAGAGLPDESRAGRVILRDYTNGKLVYCMLPPGGDAPSWVPSGNDAGNEIRAASARQLDDFTDEETGSGASSDIDETASGDRTATNVASKAGLPVGLLNDAGAWEEDELASSSLGGGAIKSGVRAHTLYSLPKFGPFVSDRPPPLSASSRVASGSCSSSRSKGASGAPGSAAVGGVPLDEADLELLEEMGRAGGIGNQRQRPEYKFNKKAARTKGNRGQQKGEGGFDGGAMLTGKKGGLVRATGY